jgi:hypothetical protein
MAYVDSMPGTNSRVSVDTFKTLGSVSFMFGLQVQREQSRRKYPENRRLCLMPQNGAVLARHRQGCRTGSEALRRRRFTLTKREHSTIRVRDAAQ